MLDPNESFAGQVVFYRTDKYINYALVEHSLPDELAERQSANTIDHWIEFDGAGAVTRYRTIVYLADGTVWQDLYFADGQEIANDYGWLGGDDRCSQSTDYGHIGGAFPTNVREDLRTRGFVETSADDSSVTLEHAWSEIEGISDPTRRQVVEVDTMTGQVLSETVYALGAGEDGEDAILTQSLHSPLTIVLPDEATSVFEFDALPDCRDVRTTPPSPN